MRCVVGLGIFDLCHCQCCFLRDTRVETVLGVGECSSETPPATKESNEEAFASSGCLAGCTGWTALAGPHALELAASRLRIFRRKKERHCWAKEIASVLLPRPCRQPRAYEVSPKSPVNFFESIELVAPVQPIGIR